MFKKKTCKPEALSWAEREISVVMERELTGKRPDDDYIRLCYESAMSAYRAISGHGHSGMSISFTKFILNRLIDRKPLTAIVDKDFDQAKPIDYGSEYLNKNGLKEVYQCPRYSSMFKNVLADGSIKYSDNSRVETVDRNGATCSCGFITRMVDKMYPLELPYWPVKPYRVYTTEFTYDSENDRVQIDPGVYNAMYISHLITPSGERVQLDTWYFEEDLVFTEKALKRVKAQLEEALLSNGLPLIHSA